MNGSSHWYHRWVSRPHPLIVALVAVSSLALLWQGLVAERGPITDRETRGLLIRGTITAVLDEHQEPVNAFSQTTVVQELSVRIVDPDTGDKREVTVVNDVTPLKVGDRIYVNGLSLGSDHENFNILDVDRTRGLAMLFAAFMLIVVLVGGYKGINALIGTLFSLAVIFGYAVPTILHGGNPVLVGLAASAVILIGTFYVSYGFDGKSLSALAGIVFTLILVGYVGQWVVGALHFTGFGDESSLYLNQETNNAINLIGLVIAGIIIAAIGVLDDVAITQSSAVYEFARVSPVRGWELFRRAMRIGTDHISGVINTLVLAYAGASLPLVILLYISNFPIGFSLGGELVAEEIVRTLVSSAGLVLAVPLTTAVAVIAVSRWGAGGERL